MKIVILGFSLAAATHGFAPTQFRKSPGTALSDQKYSLEKLFQPIHGHGSGEAKLDQIYKDEQSVLKDRKQHFRKKLLHDKYAKKKSWIEELIAQPLHAHGSGENDSDSMFAAQQQVLYERREYYGNKNMLRKKYRKTAADHLRDISVHPHDPALLNKKEDDAMYIDTGASNKGFRFIPFPPKLKP